MKKTIIFGFAISILFACHDYKQDAEKLTMEKNSLIQSSEIKDSTINSFLATFNEIEANLREITQKQLALKENTASPNELKTTQVDRIRENINSINELMKVNKEKLAALTRQLKKSNFKVDGLEKMIAGLNQQIEEKNLQLTELNQQLALMQTKVDSLYTDVNTLTAQNMAKQIQIEDQTLKLHKGYVVTGTEKELLSKQVIIKTGGFLGIGKEEKLKDNLNQSAFKPVDVTQTDTIPIHAKDAELLTYHPSDSYSIQHEGSEVSRLLITDPDKFWMGSKYLVVMIDK